MPVYVTEKYNRSQAVFGFGDVKVNSSIAKKDGRNIPSLAFTNGKAGSDETPDEFGIDLIFESEKAIDAVIDALQFIKRHYERFSKVTDDTEVR